MGLKKEVKVILVEPSREGNIGAIARSISNFDAAGLILVNPQTEISDTAYRRASHAKDVLENLTIYPSLEKAIIGIDYIVATTARLARYRNIQRTAVSPRKMTNILENVTGTVGFLFGRESSGLTNIEVQQADLIVSIPTSEKYPVLNLSHAVAVILYEYRFNQLTKQTKLLNRLASSEEKEIMDRYLHSILPRLGMPQYKIEKTHQAFSNLIGRAAISRREVTLLMGLLKRISDALRLAQKSKNMASTV